MSRIGIIGAGPAGLALAHSLGSAGQQVSVFEARPELGGFARSLQFGPLRVDRYYHFLCGSDTGYMEKLVELGIEDKLRWAPTRMGFFYSGTLYPFSSALDLLTFDGIRPIDRLRYGLLVLHCWLNDHWQQLDALPAEGWLQSWLGSDAYRATWYPLLKVKFNQYHDQVSAAWAWHRVHRVANSRKTPLHREMLGYLHGGTRSLIEALASEIRRQDNAVLPERPVQRISMQNGQISGLYTRDGQYWPFDYVVSTVPLPIFLDIAPDLPAEYRTKLASVDYLGVVCLILRLRHPLTENYWLNVNDPCVPFNGCIEYTNLDKRATPDGSTILYVPYYLPISDERFSYSDERLLQECQDALQIINPDFGVDWILDAAVSRDPYAQAICNVGFASRVPALQTPIRNLYLIESSQLYPSDRTISGTIDLASKVAAMIARQDHSQHTYVAPAARSSAPMPGARRSKMAARG
jgi:protoporphyrinogen oxidase